MELSQVESGTKDVLSSKSVERATAPRTSNVRKAKASRPALSGAERERLRAALHDGLGQALTSISFLATSLRHKLSAKDLPEAADAGEILALTGRAISETQALVTETNPPSES